MRNEDCQKNAQNKDLWDTLYIAIVCLCLVSIEVKLGQKDSKSQRQYVEYWRGNWTVSDVTGHAGVTGRYLANAIISDKSK